MALCLVGASGVVEILLELLAHGSLEWLSCSLQHLASRLLRF